MREKALEAVWKAASDAFVFVMEIRLQGDTAQSMPV